MSASISNLTIPLQLLAGKKSSFNTIYYNIDYKGSK